jgi:DNA polymerase-3 subunit epsilon
MRQIILDTETTGLDPATGDRIIEIGCVELIDRELTGNNYHQYINPERSIHEGAIAVHGLTEEFLEAKPIFKVIAKEFVDYIEGAELIIHNAPFDVGFINAEFRLLGNGLKVEDLCSVFDTLKVARAKHVGQRNSLDALCKRYGVDNTSRTLHGALLDAELLSHVYLGLTGGQVALSFGFQEGSNQSHGDENSDKISVEDLLVIQANQEEMKAHEEYLAFIEGE